MANCGFNKPQSLVLGPNALFVADTGSHAIRRIDLFNGEVNTIAGNGKAGQSVVLARSDARDIALNFPSGLALRETMLYFTMMAQHQVWQVDLKTGAMSWLAGSGQQSVTDGDSVTAAFSSPSSIAVAEEELFIADSEGSAIRSFELDSSVVTSRIGQGNFYFGNEDGGPRDGLLQRPMGLAYDRDKQELWIADTYNSCLRLLDTINWRLTTPAVDFELNHPTGICVHDRTLWVANSNEHEILKIDLATHRSEPFEILETSV